MKQFEREVDKTWVEAAAVTAPALLGAAGGVVLGNLVHERARGPLALALAGVGIAALTPLISLAIADKVKGPQTRRGSQRTLQGIRDGGIGLHHYQDENFEDEQEQIGIG